MDNRLSGNQPKVPAIGLYCVFLAMSMGCMTCTKALPVVIPFWKKSIPFWNRYKIIVTTIKRYCASH